MRTRRYPTPAHTYYIDATTGVDTQSGAADLPLQTIAAVNALALKPGDRVLFQRGETWATTQLLITQAGRGGRPIVFAAYGSGALPIIQSPVGSAYSSIYVTGSCVAVKSLHALTQEHATNDAYGIRIAGHDVVVDGCTVQGNKTLGAPYNKAMGIDAYQPGATCYNLIIANNTIYDCGWTGGTHGIEVGYSSYPGATNVQITDNTIYDIGGTAYSFTQFGIYLIRADHALCRGNTIYNTDSDGIQLEYTTNSVIEKNTVHHAGLRGIGYFYCAAGDNTFVNNNLVYLCRSSGIRLTNCAEAHIYHNTVVNCGTIASSWGMDIAAGVTGAYVKNNVVVNDYAVVGAHLAFHIGATDAEINAVVDGSEIDYNCCMFINNATADRAYGRGGGSYSLASWRAFGTTNHPELNGIMDDPLFASSVHTTVDATSAAGQKVLNVAATAGFNAGETVAICPNGARREYGVIDTIEDGVSLTLLVNLASEHTAVQADSVLSCVWTDLHLQVGSPAIAAGDATVGVLTDYDSVVRGVAVDIGAYEYVA